MEDLNAYLASSNEQIETVKASMKSMSARKKELEDLIRYAELYRETKPVYAELNSIRWKGKRKKYEEEHERELNTFHMVNRKLEKYRTPDGKIPIRVWQQELAGIERNHKIAYEQYKPVRDDLMKLLRVKSCVDTVLRQQEQTDEKQLEMRNRRKEQVI